MMKLPAARGLGRPHARSRSFQQRQPRTPDSQNNLRFHMGGGTHAQPEGSRLQVHPL